MYCSYCFTQHSVFLFRFRRAPLCYNGELLLLGAYPSETHMGNPSQEALGNAEWIIQEWIDTAMGLGGPIPEPKAVCCSREG